MRPYLAVIKDSFREAMATRVLWILLVLTVLLLGVLAPFGYEVALPSRIQFPELTDPRAFLEHVKEKKDDTTTAASYVWKKLPEETRERLEKVNEDTGGVDRRRAIGELLSSVNRQAGKREFFDENVFSNVKNNEEARKLIEHGLEQLDDEQVARLNRLALDSAFGDYIEPAGKEAIQFYYLSFELGNPAPLTVNALKQIMSMSLAGFSDLIIGVLGVFIAILVTSPIIPQMFEPGAIDLLLSKPVSRSLLFLSKFFGGCIFILLIATVLITGCWAILGFQFDIWNAGLLWTIPVFVFVFAIYYTISAFAAVIWRNPVVSIVLAIVFWTVCFVVGLTKGIMEQNILDERRVAAIVPTSESLLITTENGGLSEWSGYNSTWERRYSHRGAGPFNQQARYPFIGPYLDAKEDRLIGVLDPPGRAQFFGGSAKIAVAEKENDWKPRPTVTAPAGARDLMIGEDGTIFVAGSRGLFRLKGDPGNEGDSVKVFGFQVPGLGTGPVFQPVRIEGELKWRRPVTAAMNPATGAFAIRSGEVITVIRPDRNLGYTLWRRPFRARLVTSATASFLLDRMVLSK